MKMSCDIRISLPCSIFSNASMNTSYSTCIFIDILPHRNLTMWRPLSQMLNGILEQDHMQWHHPLISSMTTLHDIVTKLDLLSICDGCDVRRRRLHFWTPGPIPFGVAFFIHSANFYNFHPNLSCFPNFDFWTHCSTMLRKPEDARLEHIKLS